MEEYIGIIKPFVGNYAPEGWLFCDGSLVPISNYTALFAIMSNRYGGDARTNFGLPDLRCRIPIGMGSAPPLTTRNLGDKNGTETVTITASTFPMHSHVFNGLNGPRETTNPSGNYLGISAGNFYCQLNTGDSLIPMNTKTVSVAPGNSEPHDNMPPFLVVNYIICYEGIYPVRP